MWRTGQGQCVRSELDLIDSNGGGFAGFFSGLHSCALAPAEIPDLVDLIRSHTAEEFASEYFLKRAFLSRGEGVSRLPFFDLGRVRALLQGLNGNPHFRIDANFRSNPDDALFAIEPSQIGHLLDAGATVCLTAIHLIDPALLRMVGRLKAQLSFTGRVGANCYLSGPGAGLSQHFDAKAALVIQIQGSKRWRYEDYSSLPFPLRSGRFERAGELRLENKSLSEESWETIRNAARGPLHEVLLQPGDVLCLAPGALHEAEAGNDSSLALTIGFQPSNTWDIFSALIAKEFRKSERWRAGIPAQGTTPPRTPPEVVLSHFEKSLQELRAFVGSLSACDHRLLEAWYSSISAEPLVRNALPANWFAGASSVQLLESQTASLHCYQVEQEERISLHHFGLKLTFTESARSILVALVEGKAISLNNETSAIDLKVLKLLADKQLIGPAGNAKMN